jgi:hypothetical protein
MKPVIKDKVYPIFFLLIVFTLSGQQPAFFMLGEEKFRGVQIYDVIQDEKLNYLFATNEGIYYFDYYNYKKIECDKAKSSSVFNFVMSKDGTIYCNNLNNQIFRIRNGNCGVFYELKNDEVSSDLSLSIADNRYLVIGGRKITVLDEKGNVKLSYPVKNHYLGPAFKTRFGNIHFHLDRSDSILSYSNGKITKHKLGNSLGQLSESVLKFFSIDTLSFALDLKPGRNIFMINRP